MIARVSDFPALIPVTRPSPSDEPVQTARGVVSYADYCLSEVLRLQGREVEALVAMDAAIALEPAAGSLRWQRGRLLEALGRLPEACASYAEAVAREPERQIAQRMLTKACERAGSSAIPPGAAAAGSVRSEAP